MNTLCVRRFFFGVQENKFISTVKGEGVEHYIYFSFVKMRYTHTSVPTHLRTSFHHKFIYNVKSFCLFVEFNVFIDPWWMFIRLWKTHPLVYRNFYGDKYICLYIRYYRCLSKQLKRMLIIHWIKQFNLCFKIQVESFILPFHFLKPNWKPTIKILLK